MSAKLWVFPALLPLPFPLPHSPSVILSVGLCGSLCVSLTLCVAPSMAFCHSLFTQLVRKRDVLRDVAVLLLWEDQCPGFSVTEENVGICYFIDQLTWAGFSSPFTSAVGRESVYFITLH